MGLYGSTAGVRGLLASQGTNDWSEDELARINTLLPTVSAIIESDTGATFGEAEPETVEVQQYAPIYGRLLYLPKGLRSVTGVVADPTWGILGWEDGTALAANQYRLTARSIDGVYRALLRVDGYWAGMYLVTGLWEDTSEDVPEEIHYLANYLAAEIFKKQKASPAGFVGPDGVAVAVRNTFIEPEVKRILDMHRVNRSLVVF